MQNHSSRTHSSDRGQGAAQAAPPISQQEVDRLSRIASTARRSAAWKQWRQNTDREVSVFGFSSASSVPSAARSSVMRRRVSSSSWASRGLVGSTEEDGAAYEAFEVLRVDAPDRSHLDAKESLAAQQPAHIRWRGVELSRASTEKRVGSYDGLLY